MKTQHTLFFKQLIKPAIFSINGIVEESKKAKTKIFSAIDMWNIQRGKKGVLVR